MKSKLLMIASLILILWIYSAVEAQLSIFSGTSTAGAVNDTMIFNCDFIDPFGLPNVNVTLHYKGQSQTSFSTAPMTLIQGDPHYLTTQESRLLFNSNQGLMQYYFSGGSDTLMLTQVPFYSLSATWPAVGLFADFAADPVGDTMSGTPGSWSDLTGYGMTYSNTKLYAYLSNVSGTWPSSQGLTSLNLYGIALIRPSIQDTAIFAMIYVNLWPLVSPGIYKINIADSSFTRVADASSTTSGGRLLLSCNLADLAADPDWPGWPPQEGYLLTLAITAVGSLTTPALCDYTMPTAFIPQSQAVDFNANSAPHLYNPGFIQIPSVSLTGHIAYHDSDNNLPKIRRLYFDRGVFEMASFDHVYSDTALFEYTMTWPGDGWHYYYFVFNDGRDSVFTPLDSIYLTTADIVDDDYLPKNISLAQNYPNPFNGSTCISYRLPEDMRVALTIYDIAGRQVATLADEIQSAGYHSVIWDGIDKNGMVTSSGFYFYKLRAGDFSYSRKMLLLK
ncbi:MAG: T9SS type A sorting domain-containing protein [candidate division Zixibacteria bacterium]|nr:T9SS type A sorting domain-containing protein [candidate division Zixibacteria bacterium]